MTVQSTENLYLPRAGVVLPHLCRVCGVGRIVQSDGPEGQRRYWCSNCVAESEGSTYRMLCFCGHKVTVRRGTTPVNAGLRCAPNPHPTMAAPNTLLVQHAAARAMRPAQPPGRIVSLPRALWADKGAD